MRGVYDPLGCNETPLRDAGFGVGAAGLGTIVLSFGLLTIVEEAGLFGLDDAAIQPAVDAHNDRLHAVQQDKQDTQTNDRGEPSTDSPRLDPQDAPAESPAGDEDHIIYNL